MKKSGAAKLHIEQVDLWKILKEPRYKEEEILFSGSRNKGMIYAAKDDEIAIITEHSGCLWISKVEAGWIIRELSGIISNMEVFHEN